MIGSSGASNNVGRDPEEVHETSQEPLTDAERYLPMIWWYACAQSWRNVHVAEDVVAETFLALAWNQKSKFARRPIASTWLLPSGARSRKPWQ